MSQAMSLVFRVLCACFIVSLASCGGHGGQGNAPAPALLAQSAVLAPPIILSGPKANYSIINGFAGLNFVDNTGADASQPISASTRLRFTDSSMAFAIDDVPGQAYRLYQAAFGRTPDGAGLGYWIGQMENGATLDAVAAAFVTSAECKALYGIAPSSDDIIAKYYQNVLHRDGEATGVNYWVSVLNQGTSQATVLAGFSESMENKAGVLPAIQDGIT
jgi:hypothetical protein